MLRVAFLGRGYLGMSVLQGLLEDTRIDLRLIISCSATSEVRFNESDFEKIANKKGIKFYKTNNINTDFFEEVLISEKIDLAVAMLWLYIINEKIINTSKFGFLNLHGGFLPKYRGNACYTWAILNHEKEFGLTCHLMEGGKLDSGPIIQNLSVTISSEDKVGDLVGKADLLGPELVLDSINMFIENKIQLTKQDETKASYSYPRLPRDGEIFWTNKSFDIITLIKASGRPYPGAYSWFEDRLCSNKVKKLVIFDAHIESHFLNEFYAVPGQLIKFSKNTKWSVVAGDHKLVVLDEIEIDGVTTDPFHLNLSIRQRLGLDLGSALVALQNRVESLEAFLKK
jgi:methionyl-tRNA formyltransferase